jgi:signal transduction histidine kinase
MSFDVPRVIATKRRRHLGIIGMRERTEMLGGTFEIESTPGEGTTVRVQIRLHNGTDKTAPRRQAGGARCPGPCPNHDNPPSMIGRSP